MPSLKIQYGPPGLQRTSKLRLSCRDGAAASLSEVSSWSSRVAERLHHTLP